MYEQLLVALDGSPAAEQVLVHAEALARAFHSTLTLLRATVAPEMLIAESTTADAGVGQMAPTLDPTPLLEAERSSAIDYLERVARPLRDKGLRVNTEYPPGPANEAVVERASAIGASLILMTTHGRSGFGRMVFGSVADSVLRHASCPVLLVRVAEES